MKKAIIITSAIEVDNDIPFTYSKTRTYFSKEERYRQTVSTIANLDCACDSETTLYLLDVSKNYLHILPTLSYQRNLKFIFVAEHLPEILDTVRTHPNKSHCENLLLSSFLEKFKDELKQYDFVFKFSGRYLTDRTFDLKFFNEHTPKGFYFKTPLKFEWNDGWKYTMVDRRSLQNDNYLYQYCTVLYGWSKEYFDAYHYIVKIITEICAKPEYMHYDVETLMYYFTRQYANEITEMPWIVYGWDGTSGQFLRY